MRFLQAAETLNPPASKFSSSKSSSKASRRASHNARNRSKRGGHSAMSNPALQRNHNPRLVPPECASGAFICGRN